MVDVIASARAEGRTLLTEAESKELLHGAGIPVTRARVAKKAKEAVEYAEEMGYPIVLKIVSSDIAHKSDVGGVAVGIDSAKALRTAFKTMMERVSAAAPGARIDGISVQQQAKQGTEVIVGATTDPQFGPVMMFGLGGVFVEVLKDVAFRVVPLEPRDARQMVREIRGFPILEGVRGGEAADLDALESLILKVSDFVAQHPEIAELDLNPVFAYGKGALAVDARVVLAEAKS
ncbi:MAG: acetate--CoA ligase family protein [Chloroflexi bacterium]|nr:acetate--CoA ligase family protein [Chloroflexota bacterium]MDA1240620.1 acetate--CoA ligase family protein [Chloroflexota bacterium]